MKTILNNSIIIFDEAHNMLEVCENSASAHISMFEINRACRDMRHVSEKISSAHLLTIKM